MSFKRDGDDKCALDNQRKRRVAELLCEEIEEDEVTRLSNGKYKCKLCSHQPIFDTLSMFYVHKQGKKHQYSIEYAAQQKQELADLIEKRKQENVTKTGPAVYKQTDGNTVSMATASKTLGTKKPRRPHERKPIIDFNISPNSKEVLPVPIETTSGSVVPGNRSDNANGTTTSALQKPFGESVRTSSSSGRSYTEDKHLATGADKDTKAFNMWNKSASQPCKGDNVISAKNVHKLVGQSNTELSNKFYLSRKKQREDTGSMFRNNGVGKKDDDHKPSTTSPAQTWQYYKDFKGKVPFKMKSLDKHMSKVSSSFEEAKDLPKQETISSTSNTAEDCSSQEKKERAEKFLNAIGSGWKRDWTGSWVKDEDAEFDSDEEPPDIS